MSKNPTKVQPSPTSRDPKTSNRWDQIVKAAAGLFAVKGFHRTTTKEIAEAAKVSEGTLYNYFDSKDEIMVGILTQLIEAQKTPSRSSAPVSMDASQFFSAYLNQRKEHLDQNYVMMQALISEILSNESLRESYYKNLMEPSMKMEESLLRMRMAIGQIREVDPALTSRFMSALLLGIFLLKAMGDPLIDSRWDELVDLTTTMIFEGLAPDRG